MSSRLITAVCNCDLPPTLKAVAKELAWFADDNGEKVFPSIETVTRRTSLCRRTVQKKYRELQKLEIILAVGNGLGGRYRSTEYRFNLQKLAELCRSGEPRQGAKWRRPPAPKGESYSADTANVATGKSVRGSPKQYEYEMEENQHAIAKALPATPANWRTPRHHYAFGAAMRTWITIKDELRQYLSQEEWNRWVRPALLTKLVRDKVYLVGFPPNGGIIEAAQKQKPLLQKIARDHNLEGIVFTRYPDESELVRIRELYPEQWQSIAPALRAKVEQ